MSIYKELLKKLNILKNYCIINSNASEIVVAKPIIFDATKRYNSTFSFYDKKATLLAPALFVIWIEKDLEVEEKYKKLGIQSFWDSAEDILELEDKRFEQRLDAFCADKFWYDLNIKD